MKHLICRYLSNCAYIAVFALVASFSALPALGQIAQPGYDLFQTASGASVDLGTLVTPSTVDLVGVPIQTSVTGTADTIMYRPDAVPSSCATNPPCQIPVNLYALFMESSSPVTYNGQSADVYITVNASGGNIAASALPQCDTLTASTGTLTLTPNSAGTSGTFNSSITVYADVIIMAHGVSPSCTAKLTSMAAPSISLTTTNSPFSTTAPSGSPNAIVPERGTVSGAGSLASSSSSSYSSGGIYFNPHHNGPHPVAPAQNCTPLTSPSGPQPLGKQDNKPVGATPELRICPASPIIPTTGSL
jgi:hypothetical protein